MTFEKIKNALAEQFDVDPSSISSETSLIDDIGADSLDIVELIMAVEDEFGIHIPDEEAAALTTVGKIVAYIDNKL